MKQIMMFVLVFITVNCQNSEEYRTGSNLSNAEFKYAVLPKKGEWTVKLVQPLSVVRQEIQHTPLPEPVWTAFPLPEFQDGAGTRLVTIPDFRRSYGYGMDTAGCVPEALIKTNGIQSGKGWGIGGGQYAYYQRVEINDSLLYDPRQYAFLISYTGAYLEVTFPDLQTMRVSLLKTPNMSTAKHCGPGADGYKRLVGND